MSHDGRVQIGIEGTLAAGIGANGSLTYLFGLDKLHMCPLRRGEQRSAWANKASVFYRLRCVLFVGEARWRFRVHGTRSQRIMSREMDFLVWTGKEWNSQHNYRCVANIRR